MTTNDVTQEFGALTGGPELAEAAIRHFGEEAFWECLPIYRAICKLEAEENARPPSIAHLAEAIQYKNLANLDNLATFGAHLNEMNAFDICGGIHALAIRAEAIRRITTGGPSEYRTLLERHNVHKGCPPFMPHDRDINALWQRRKAQAA